MVSTLLMAIFGGAGAMAATAVVTGDTGAVVGLAHMAPHGLQIALSHVSSASHAYSVLKEHLSMYAGTGTAGSAALGGSTAVKHALHSGLGR